jgi:hypothetical protein
MVLPSAGAKVPSSVTILNSTLEMQCLLLHEYPFSFLINDHVVAVACLLFLEERFLVIPKPEHLVFQNLFKTFIRLFLVVQSHQQGILRELIFLLRILFRCGILTIGTPFALLIFSSIRILIMASGCKLEEGVPC